MEKTELDLSTKCRACFSEEQEMHYLFGEFDQGLSLSEILQSVTSFEIQQDDGLPPYLCENCTTVVVDFFNFSTVYQENEKYMKSLLGDNKIVLLSEVPNADETKENNKIDISGESEDLKGSLDLAAIATVFEGCEKEETIEDYKFEVSGSYIDPQDIGHANFTEDEIITKYDKENTKIVSAGYTCEVCGKLFLLKSNLQRHMQKKHKHIKLVYQNDCDNTNSRYSNIVVKDDVNLKCDSSDKHLKGHKKFMCEHCGASFVKKSYLDDHREIHTTERRHICPMCGKAFRRRTVLVKHKRIHTHPRQCVCEICGYRFNDKGTLVTHIKLKHIRERNYHCTICGLNFPLKSTLNKHIFRHNEQKESPFICSICPTAYRDKSSLNRHMIVKHTDNVKKPSCEFCNKEYTTNTNLLKHIRRHHSSKQNFDSNY